MASSKSVSNEDLLELLQESMQMTSDGFVRLDKRMEGIEDRMGGLEGRMDNLEGHMDNLEGRMGGVESGLTLLTSRVASLEAQVTELKKTVDKVAGEQKAQANDIKDILDRLVELEKLSPNITDIEVKEMQAKLQALLDWAVESAKHNNIPLRLPN